MRTSLLLLALVAGCRDDFQLDPSVEPGNVTPLAQAGTGSTFTVDATVQLDGSASFDPDGQIVAYRWMLVQRPPGSAAVLDGENAVVVTFTPDLPGAYRAQLEVMDDDGAGASSSVVVTVKPPGLVVDAGADRSIPWLARPQLAGTFSVASPFTATYAWAFAARPLGSVATLDNASTLTPSFLADVVGTYTLTLTATSEFETKVDTVTVEATATPLELGRANAVYDRALDKLLLVSSDSSTLTLHDLGTGMEQVVPVGMGAYDVALQPSGLRAAIGLAAQGDDTVKVVDLQTAAVIATIPDLDISTQLAYGPDNRIYFGNVTGDLVAVDISTNASATTHPFTGFFGNHFGLAVNPAGTAMYMVAEFVSSRIARFDITTSPVTLQREAELDLDPSFTPPFEFTEDGSSIMSSLGLILRTSADAAIDFTVAGQIMPTPVVAAHSSSEHAIAALGQEYAMGSYAGTRLTLYDDATMTPTFTTLMPKIDSQFVQPIAISYRANGDLLITVRKDFQTLNYLFVVTPP